MLQNYLTVVLRNFKKQKLYSFVNIFGLALGLACFLLIGTYIKHELSYDRYHPEFEKIYRVVEIIKDAEESSSLPFSAGPAMANDFPDQIDKMVRFFNHQAPSYTLEYNNDKTFREKNLFFADSTVFDVFAFPFLKGDPLTALKNPNSIVLTQSLAEKYFGEEEPIGKMLKYEGTELLQVTAILDEVPANSHFTFDGLISFSTLRKEYNGEPSGWVWNPNWTYVKLKEGISPEQIDAQFPAFVEAHYPDFIKADVSMYLQPLKDIHLHSHLDYEAAPNSDIAYIYIFLAIAFFIILIAAINYMNLATARSAQRAKEVGMRKTLGARKHQLVMQFLGESVLTCIVAGIFSLILLNLLLPFFNTLAGKSFQFIDMFADPLILGGFIGLTLLLGILGGIYPAFFLSAFDPIEVLKNQFNQGKKGNVLRKGLVVGQFTISIILVIATFISYQQLQLLQTKNLGFDKDQVMLIPVQLSPIVGKYESFKNTISQSPGVLEVSGTELPLGAKYQTHPYLPEGSPSEDLIFYPSLFVLPGFTETFGIKIVAGRTFVEENQNDITKAVLINEAMVKHLNWGEPENAIGKSFRGTGENAVRVIGVMQDFNTASLHQEVPPFVLDLPNNEGQLNFFMRYFAVKIKGGDVRNTIAFIEDGWKQFEPDRPMEFFFLNEHLNQLYQFEDTLSKAAGIFALLAILIACLGLFGLAAYTAERKVKEIGIRKVLGASTANILSLLSKEYTLLIGIAFVLAVPIAYVLLGKWLERFAYQTSLNPFLFILAGLTILLLAWLTVSFQSLKAARANPVDSIKTE